MYKFMCNNYDYDSQTQKHGVVTVIIMINLRFGVTSFKKEQEK